MDLFTVELVIRGYHIYEEVWSSIIGEVLVCHRDTRNCHDPFAIATCKGTTIVEHVPRRISAIGYFFLGKPNMLFCWFTWLYECAGVNIDMVLRVSMVV